MPRSEPLLTRRFVVGAGLANFMSLGTVLPVVPQYVSETKRGSVIPLRSTTTRRRTAHIDDAGPLVAEHPSP